MHKNREHTETVLQAIHLYYHNVHTKSTEQMTAAKYIA